MVGSPSRGTCKNKRNGSNDDGDGILGILILCEKKTAVRAGPALQVVRAILNEMFNLSEGGVWQIGTIRTEAWLGISNKELQRQSSAMKRNERRVKSSRRYLKDKQSNTIVCEWTCEHN